MSEEGHEQYLFRGKTCSPKQVQLCCGIYSPVTYAANGLFDL
jgi:hypothetical protein